MNYDPMEAFSGISISTHVVPDQVEATEIPQTPETSRTHQRQHLVASSAISLSSEGGPGAQTLAALAAANAAAIEAIPDPRARQFNDAVDPGLDLKPTSHGGWPLSWLRSRLGVALRQARDQAFWFGDKIHEDVACLDVF